MIPTHNEEQWAGYFGSQYTSIYNLDPEKLDAHWVKWWSVKRSTVVVELMSRLGVERGARILEVGCNCGNQLVMLKSLGFEHVKGVELNRDAVRAAQARGLDVVEGNARALAFEDASFDLVFSCGVLSHIPPECRAEAMKEMLRVSKGRLHSTEYFTSPGYRGENFVWCEDWAELWGKLSARVIYQQPLPEGWPRLAAYALHKEGYRGAPEEAKPETGQG